MKTRQLTELPPKSADLNHTLRGVDLNLLTVFDAVVKEQNITRAAYNLGMSQPAVSNAVARLRILFDDELFMKTGRNIVATKRALQLCAPIRQALQLIMNELPGAVFEPTTSNREFYIALSSPIDRRFTSSIVSHVSRRAPKLQLHFLIDYEPDVSERLRHQKIDFSIQHSMLSGNGLMSTEMFKDEFVVIASVDHPRASELSGAQLLAGEQHAVLSSVNGMHPLHDKAYNKSFVSGPYDVGYEGTSLESIMHMVSNSEMVALIPRWNAENSPFRNKFDIYKLYGAEKNLRGYLTWHESNDRDDGHKWFRDVILSVCGEVLASDLHNTNDDDKKSEVII